MRRPPRPTRTGAEPATLRDLRRRQIVQEARRIVARDGLGALTISTLEARLPFSRGVITHHFEDKDEIVDAVLESAVADIDAGTVADVRSMPDFAGRVAAVLRSKVTGFIEQPEATRILVSFWGQPGDARARTSNAALFRRYRRESRALFEHAVETGEARRDLDPEAAAVLLVGAVIGIVSLAMFEPDTVDVDAATKLAAAQIVADARHRG